MRWRTGPSAARRLDRARPGRCRARPGPARLAGGLVIAGVRRGGRWSRRWPGWPSARSGSTRCGVAAELLNLLPGVHLHSGLTAQEAAIVTELRLPRVVLGLLVGAMLALAGGCYQGVFRNPLADPYLLGVAAGAGLGATVAVALGVATDIDAGVRHRAAAASRSPARSSRCWLTYVLGAAGGRVRTPTTLILAGVAVAAFLAAIQTYLLQRNVETIREVYSWLLGSLATDGWHEVALAAAVRVLIAAIVVLALRRELDVLSVGDDEAASLGPAPAAVAAISWSPPRRSAPPRPSRSPGSSASSASSCRTPSGCSPAPATG